MSQSSKTIREFGSLSLLKDSRVKSGSTSAVTPYKCPAPTSLADAAATLTVDQLKTGMFVMTPTAARTLTLPTATLMSAFLTSIGDCMDFSVINLGGDTFHLTIAAGTNGSTVGYMVVRDSDATAASDTGSARFRIRQTAVSGTPTYVVYRL